MRQISVNKVQCEAGIPCVTADIVDNLVAPFKFLAINSFDSLIKIYTALFTFKGMV